MFIARVSRGRTIREFVTGVLFVPAGFTLMWMTVFGNSAIYLIMNQGATDLANTVQQDVALALFNFLEHFPFSPCCHSSQWRWSSSSLSRLLTRGQW
jgi:choline/glycine/proline betaine transport protein